MLVTSIFSFSHKVFYPIRQNKFRFLSQIYFVVCKRLQIGEVQNFVTGKKLSHHVQKIEK